MRTFGILAILALAAACAPHRPPDLLVHTKEGTLEYRYPRGDVTASPPRVR